LNLVEEDGDWEDEVNLSRVLERRQDASWVLDYIYSDWSHQRDVMDFKHAGVLRFEDPGKFYKPFLAILFEKAESVWDVSSQLKIQMGCPIN
jgi:hypothetical protein